MDPRPIIYVNRITNLSDARYCAGMGVDLLGFVITPGHPDYISHVQFHEIMGWVTGPKRVVEIVDDEPVNIEEVIAQYAPDIIHITLKVESTGQLPSFPMILETRFNNWSSVQNKIKDNVDMIEYVVLTGSSANAVDLIAQENKFSFLLPCENENSVKEVQRKPGVSGFLLRGTPELTPGLKDYDHLSKILEALEL